MNAFRAYDRRLENMTAFKYLGHILKATDDECLAVVENLRKSSNKWTQFSRIVVWEGEDMLMLGLFYKAMVKSVLVFGLEMWVATLYIYKTLGGFQRKVDRKVTGNNTWRQINGS